GDEKFIVVATSEPSKDLAGLANVVFRKPNKLLTAAEQEQQTKLKAVCEEKLKSIDEKLAGARTRGVLKPDRVNAFMNDVKTKNQCSIEEPPHDGEPNGFAMAVSQPDGGKPELLVNLTLHSLSGATSTVR